MATTQGQKEADRRYRERHREALKAKRLERYRTDERYGAAKQSAWRAANPDKHRASVKAYKARNPDLNAVLCTRRRARRHRSDGSYATNEWQALKALYGFRCLRCGRAEPEIVLTFDHVVPLAKGGTDSVENGQPLCKDCNTWKNVKVIDYRPLQAA